MTTGSDHKPGKCTGAECTLREAVIRANDRSGKEKIVLRAADGPFELTREGTGEDAARKGDLDLADDHLTIQGKGSKRSLVKQTAADRVFEGLATTANNNVELSRLTVSGGRSDQSGGGIYTQGQLFLGKVSVRDNRASQGGGIYALPGDASLGIATSTITGNLSPKPDPLPSYSTGGGIFVESTFAGAGTVVIGQTTVAANEAPAEADPDEHRASNVYAEVLTQLENTIIGADLGGAPSCDLPIDSAGHHLDHGTTCGLDQGTDLENADAALKPLDDNGGPTKTMALPASSDAIGEGSCPGTLVQRGVDQRGLGRPSICDIGAFERDPLP